MKLIKRIRVAIIDMRIKKMANMLIDLVNRRKWVNDHYFDKSPNEVQAELKSLALQISLINSKINYLNEKKDCIIMR